MADSPLKPLIVKGLARTGSTLLMNCLSQIDAIAVALQQPCEVRYAQYLASAYEVLTARADLKNSARPNFFHPDEHKNWIGRNPFNRRLKKGYAKYFDDDYSESIRMLFVDKVDGFYRHVAKINGVDPGFFCEKALYISQGRLEQDPDAIHRLFPEDVRAIYLVRDPRDVLCSNRAFFHARENTDEETWSRAAERLGRHASAMAESYRKNRNESKFVVHYEDLVRVPERVLAEVIEFLGLETQPDNVKSAIAFARKAATRRHKTTASPAASIDRWKTELSEDMQKYATKCFARYCKTFGYT